MKKLLAISILATLFSGCKVASNSREHQIVCFSSVDKSQQTYDIIIPGNPLVFVAHGHSVLAYRDNNGKVQVIYLAQNDCVIY